MYGVTILYWYSFVCVDVYSKECFSVKCTMLRAIDIVRTSPVLCALCLSPIPWYVEWIYIYYEYIGKYKHARIHFVDGKYIHIIHARRNFCARFVTNAPSHRLSCMRINVYPIHTQSKLMLVVCVFEIMWINPLGSRNVDKAKCLYKNAHQKTFGVFMKFRWVFVDAN